MFSASPISLTDVYTPSSSIRCHRHARASALTSVPSGCGFEVGAISLPSGATMRLHRRGSCQLSRFLHIPSKWMARGMDLMAGNVHELRPRTGDTEKITINLGYVDLGHIDLMVQEGFYSNRTDFIRTAIRNQLERHADAVKRSVAHKSLDLGLRHYSREDLEAVRAAGQTLHIHVLGLASIAHDVTPELACATIESVVVLGALRASPAVKAALADRIR